MPVGYKGNRKFVRAVHSVTEDGAIGFSSSKQYEIRHHSDGRVEGLTDESRLIIEKYELNDALEIEFRVNNKRISELSRRPETDHNNPLAYFQSSLSQIAILNRNAFKNVKETENLLRCMLYANAFSAIEAFLSDYLIGELNRKPEVLANFGAKYEKFRNEKVSLKVVISENKSPLDLAEEYLNNTVFHNFGVVKNIYQAAFGIKFPNYGDLSRSIVNRHDIVHRNGCRPGEDKPEKYSKDTVLKLLLTMQVFVVALFTSLNKNNH